MMNSIASNCQNHVKEKFTRYKLDESVRDGELLMCIGLSRTGSLGGDAMMVLSSR